MPLDGGTNVIRICFAVGSRTDVQAQHVFKEITSSIIDARDFAFPRSCNIERDVGFDRCKPFQRQIKAGVVADIEC